MLRSCIIACAHKKFANVQIIISGTGVGEQTDIDHCQMIINQDIIHYLSLDIEEADNQLILHALHSVTHDITRIIQLSNDTDVLATHYWSMLTAHGLQE